MPATFEFEVTDLNGDMPASWHLQMAQGVERLNKSCAKDSHFTCALHFVRCPIVLLSF